MRKVVLVLVILVLGISPLKVKADSGGPSLNPYDVIVAREEAVIFNYDYKSDKLVEVKKIEKGTKLKVEFEYYFDKEWYGVVYYENIDYYVKISDLMVADTKIDFERKEWTKTVEYYVFGEDVYLYNGPSKLYDKVSKEKIPAGTILRVEVNDGEDSSMWGYTTYNGVSGWLFVSYNGVVHDGTPEVAWVNRDSKKV